MNKYVFKTFLFCAVFFVCVSSIGVIISAYNKKIYIHGKTVLIDAGHGGKDDGASVGNVLEDYINLSISEYLMEELIGLGSSVLISRTGDYDLSSIYKKNKKREDLKQRVNYINWSRPDLFVSIHLNTFPEKNVKGAQVFYQNNERSVLIAKFIQNELNKLTKSDKNAKFGDYFILNKSERSGVLIECGFLSNDDERLKLNSSAYQKEIAVAIKNGIVNFFVNK